MSATNGHVLNDRQKVGLNRDAISFAIKQKKELADDLDAYFWSEIAKVTGFTVDALNKRLRHARNGFDDDGETPFKETDFFEGMSEEKRGEKGPPDGVDCFLTNTQLARGDFRLTWLVKLLIVAGQPLLIGGAYKVLKTAILVNLALSLGSATCFLEHPAFSVPKKVRVLVVSCESGAHTLQETAKRICKTKGIRMEDADVLWWFDSYQLASEADLKRLQASIRYWKPTVVIFDPAYLMLLSGVSAKGMEAGNLFDIGPLLMKVSKCCLDAGATPIIAHHARKTGAKSGQPMELMDLAFSGFAEFARQWLLLSRREDYVAGSGSHKLTLNAGGSSGQGGLFHLNIEEGQLQENFEGRTWKVEVLSSASRNQEKQEAKLRAKEAQIHVDQNAILDALDRHAKGKKASDFMTVEDLYEKTAISKPRLRDAIADLVDKWIIEEVDVTRYSGRNNKVAQTKTGYKRSGSGKVKASAAD